MTTLSSEDTLTLNELAVEGYERVVEVKDPSVGLHGIIAIHSTRLGPALGGIRMHTYASFEAALDDALRLSKGMTYKSSTIEAGLGGGKSVIIGDPRSDKTPELLTAFGRAIDACGGAYIGAEDAGMTPKDLEHVKKGTHFLVGLEHEKSSGDPCIYTAWGTFWGIRACAQKLFGSWNLRGKKFAMQGMGGVGSLLAELLYWEGAELTISDIHPEKVDAVHKKTGAHVVSVDEIYDVECDFFVPCALGGIINDTTLPRFKCKAIAGCTNNQLAQEIHGQKLFEKGILYAPDFVINAGGLINVNCEISEAGYERISPRNGLCKIYDTLLKIFEVSKRQNIPPEAASCLIAEDNIEKGLGKRTRSAVFHHANLT